MSAPSAPIARSQRAREARKVHDVTLTLERRAPCDGTHATSFPRHLSYGKGPLVVNFCQPKTATLGRRGDFGMVPKQLDSR